MKKIILSMLVVAIASTTSFSQEKHEKQKPQRTPEERAEKQVEKLNRELSLSDDQKPKVKEIILKQEKSKADLAKQYPEKNDAFKDANRKLNQETEKEINAVLTPEQQEKQKQIRKEERDRHKPSGEKPASPAAAPSGQKPPQGQEQAPAPASKPQPK